LVPLIFCIRSSPLHTSPCDFTLCFFSFLISLCCRSYFVCILQSSGTFPFPFLALCSFRLLFSLVTFASYFASVSAICQIDPSSSFLPPCPFFGYAGGRSFFFFFLRSRCLPFATLLAAPLDLIATYFVFLPSFFKGVTGPSVSLLFPPGPSSPAALLLSYAFCYITVFFFIVSLL